MPDPCCICCTGEGGIGLPEGALGKTMTAEEQAAIQKGLAASQIVLFGPIVPLAAAGQHRVDGVGRPKFDFHTGSHYDDTKKNTKDANARANALAALIFIQFVISLAQVWVASTRLRLAKKADEPAKAETEGSFEGEVASKEPSAEEPASKSESGCVAS